MQVEAWLHQGSNKSKACHLIYMLAYNHVPFNFWSSFIDDTYKIYLSNDKAEPFTH